MTAVTVKPDGKEECKYFDNFDFKGNKMTLTNSEEEKHDIGYMQGDLYIHGGINLLQRARHILEKYFDEKPTMQQVIDFSAVLATKDLHSYLASLEEEGVFYSMDANGNKFGISDLLGRIADGIEIQQQ
jgi:hypothetical protein